MINLEKITIGLFTDSFYPFTDGVVMVVDNYAKRLAKYANVIVFAPKYTLNEFDDDTLPYKVVRCYSLKVPFIDYSIPITKLDKKFQKELDKYKLDIVHIHSPFTLGNAGIKYAKHNHVPSVITIHSQFKQDFLRAVKSEKLATKLNDKIIKVFNKCVECFAVNSEIARIFHDEYGLKKMPIVINNATEMITLKDDKKAINYINKKHNIKKNEKVFLFVGRINLLKNILFIADSIKAVKEKEPKLKFKMLYVGCGQDEEKLEKHIIKLGLEDDVILCGKITDRYELACYYKRADLFLFPSFYDTSSIVQVEAASQNTPTVFIKGTVTASTITDNVNGFISENTVGAYSDKIIEVIKNKHLYDKVSKNAYIDLYKTWDDCVTKVYNRYLELIKK